MVNVSVEGIRGWGCIFKEREAWGPLLGDGGTWGNGSGKSIKRWLRAPPVGQQSADGGA